MQKHRRGRWRAQEAAPECEIKSELAHARRQIRIRKVVPATVSQWFADEKDEIDRRLHAFWGIIGCCSGIDGRISGTSNSLT